MARRDPKRSQSPEKQRFGEMQTHRILKMEGTVAIAHLPFVLIQVQLLPLLSFFLYNPFLALDTTVDALPHL